MYFTRSFLAHFLLCCSLLFIALCSSSQQIASNNDGSLPTPANRELARQNIQIGEHSLLVRVAKTGETRARGLMFESNLPRNEGMLFVFPTARKVSFWMKNMRIALDISYFGGNRRLQQSQTMQADNGRSVFHSKKKVRYVLETNAGWLEKHRIQPGAKLLLSREITSVSE